MLTDNANRINALPILGTSDDDEKRYRDIIDYYYRDGLTVNGGTIGPVIGGDGNEISPAFAQTAASFNDFEASLEAKLLREITEVPFEFSPTLGLLHSGGLFAGLHWRKKLKKSN